MAVSVLDRVKTKDIVGRGRVDGRLAGWFPPAGRRTP